MTTNEEIKEQMEMGHKIAAMLLDWRPKMNPEDVSGAIMSALERYSIDTEGSSESGLSACMSKLEREFKRRRMSI